MELRAWRESEGLTLKGLQYKISTEFGINITYATLSRYERRVRKTIRSRMVDIFFAISKGLVTANDLYGHTPEIINEARNICLEKSSTKETR